MVAKKFLTLVFILSIKLSTANKDSRPEERLKVSKSEYESDYNVYDNEDFELQLRANEPGKNESNLATNVTFLLNNLLKDYDNSLRPDLGGPPIQVEINMQVRSMGPISEIDMSYSMDCYFRQSWVDRRLAFSGQKNLALSIEMLTRIWKPDTYIYNGRKSYLHTITTPNKFMRLFPNGRVLYSQRLTIRASCQMDLSDFPMDKQKCPLQIGSFGYTRKDVVYSWTSGRGVNIASDMKLSQFDLISTPTGNATLTLNKGPHSTLIVSFHLQRHMGNFVIQVYGPCVILVVISWVSFWLNREATSDRISLGVTTVLTMTFLGLEARTDLPQVAYPTALDYFVFLSFMFIFATVTQFALVHFYTKLGAGEYYLEELEETLCELEIQRKMLIEQRHRILAEQADLKNSSSSSCLENYLGNHHGIGNGSRHDDGSLLHRSSTRSFNLEEDDGDPNFEDVDDPLEDDHVFSDHRNNTLHGNGVYHLYGNYEHCSTPDLNSYQNCNSRKDLNYLNHHPYSKRFFKSKRNRSSHHGGRQRQRSRTLTSRRHGGGHGHSWRRSQGQSVEFDLANNSYIDNDSVALMPNSTTSESLVPVADLNDHGHDKTRTLDGMRHCGCKRCITRAMNNPEEALNSVSRIDKISRVVFPLTYLVLNLLYWYKYLRHSERIDLSFESS